jgi:hypothetical protein
MGRIVVSRARALLLAAAALCTAGAAQADDRRPAVQAGDVRFEALAPQTLPDGRCGLFLWGRSAADQPVFILAAFDDPAEARVRADGDRRSLARVSFGGDPVYGLFEQQRFSDGRLTLDVDVSFDDQRQVTDGAVVKHGVIKLINAEGWETVVPVGGMVACKR